MEKASTVNADLENFKKAMSNYQNEINNLSSAWKGPSYDNLKSIGEKFISNDENIVSTEMTAFAQACALYEDYEIVKGNLSKAQTNYDNATTESNKKIYSEDISTFSKKLKDLETDINNELEVASGEKIDSPSLSGDVSTNLSTSYTTNNSNVTESMQSVADIATKKSGGGYNNLCEEWAEKAWEKGTGINRELQPDAYTAWKNYGVSTDKDNIPVGAMVYGSGWPTEGGNNNPYGHVAIYIGDGKVADQGGVQDLETWASKQHANCHGHQGYIGWGWQNGIDLTKV